MEQETSSNEPVPTGKKGGGKIIAVILVIILLLVTGGFLGFKYAFVPYVVNAYVDAYDEQSEDYTQILDEMEKINDELNINVANTEEELAENETRVNRFLELTQELDKEIQEAEDEGKAPYTAGALNDVEEASDEFTDKLKETNEMYKQGYNFYKDFLPIIKEIAEVNQVLNADTEPDLTDPTVLEQTLTTLQAAENQIKTVNQNLEAIQTTDTDIKSYIQFLTTSFGLVQSFLTDSVDGLAAIKQAVEAGTATTEFLTAQAEQAEAAKTELLTKLAEAEPEGDAIMNSILEKYNDQKESLTQASNKSDEERNKLVDEYELDQEKVELR